MEDVRGGTNQGQYQGPGAGPSSQGGQPSQLGFGANREALRQAQFPDSYGARRPMIGQEDYERRQGPTIISSDPSGAPGGQQGGPGFAPSAPRGGSGNTSGPGGPITTPNLSGVSELRSWYHDLNLDYPDKDVLRSAPYQLTKLNDDNWREWSQAMRWFLESRQLFCIVDGSLPRPFDRRHANTWNVYAAHVKNIFYGNATESQKAHIPINYSVTPKDIWDKWSDVHTEKSDHKIGDLIERIFSLKAQPRDTVDKVASDLNRMNDQISQIDRDERFGDKAMGIALIRSFSGQKKYEVLITQLKVAEIITMTKVISKLKTIEQTYHPRGNNGIYDTANTAQENRPRRNLECYICGEDHIAKNCPKRFRSDEEGDIEAGSSSGRRNGSKRGSKKPDQSRGKKGNQQSRQGRNRANISQDDDNEDVEDGTI